MTGRTARVTFIGPIRLVASWRSICSGVSSSKKPATKLAALLTSTSMRAEAIDRRRDRRVGVALAGDVELDDQQALRVAKGVALTASGSRPVATTLSPAASAACAKSAPMPRPAPVINQVLVSVMSVSFMMHPRMRRRLIDSNTDSSVRDRNYLWIHAA